jgi:hypothetical protein
MKEQTEALSFIKSWMDDVQYPGYSFYVRASEGESQ